MLELNGSDERLDLDDRRARAALDAGNRFTLDSDAHYLHEFDNLDWGSVPGPPRVARATNVLNTLPSTIPGAGGRPLTARPTSGRA